MKKDHTPAPAPNYRDTPAASALSQSPAAEPLSRFVSAAAETAYPGEPAQAQCSPFYQLIYCITDNGGCLVGQLRFPLNRGDILAVPPGAVYCFSLPEHSVEACRRYVIRLSPEFVQLMQSVFLSHASALGNVPYVLPTADTEWDFLRDYFRRCAQECEQKLLQWDALIFGMATELAVQISRARVDSTAPTPGKTELLERIMVFVESHLAEKITLPDVAARFWVSQSTISQLFRKKMGMSFYHYVTLRRLSEAQLLIQSGIPMDQVSIAVGFQDYSTFYRAFKSEYGISPAQYRKNHTSS